MSDTVNICVCPPPLPSNGSFRDVTIPAFYRTRLVPEGDELPDLESSVDADIPFNLYVQEYEDIRLLEKEHGNVIGEYIIFQCPVKVEDSFRIPFCIMDPEGLSLPIGHAKLTPNTVSLLSGMYSDHPRLRVELTIPDFDIRRGTYRTTASIRKALSKKLIPDFQLFFHVEKYHEADDDPKVCIVEKIEWKSLVLYDAIV